MGVLSMSDKERKVLGLLQLVKLGRLTLVKMAQEADLSYRHARRVYRRYKLNGDEGIVHQSRGRQSNRKLSHQEQIIARYKERYEGFGPTLASEKLCAEGLFVLPETLRRWLLKEGLWSKKRTRSPYRKRREPKEQFGELIQIDGSIHQWFFDSEEYQCLLDMVDDATGITHARMAAGETTEVVFRSLWRWIELYGIPLALYVDLKTTYVAQKQELLSHVQVACKKLGIRVIKARSPQAKGRVERKHAVFQDRFVKELKLQNITTIDGSNDLLENEFIPLINKKFSKPPANPQSAHRPLGNIDLNQCLCWEYKRKVRNDWTFSFQGTTFQLHKTYGSLLKPSSEISVRRHLDGSISAWLGSVSLSFEPVVKRPVIEVSPESFKPLEVSKPLPKGTPWRDSNAFLFNPKQTDYNQKRGHF